MDDLGLDVERDNVLDVLFAMYTVNFGKKKQIEANAKAAEEAPVEESPVEETDETNGEMFLKISDVRRIVFDLIRAGDKTPELHEYDLPDLNPAVIIQNEHVDYIALDEEIAYRMEEEEAIAIIARNDELVRTISTHEYARYIVEECKAFDKDCKGLTNNIAAFIYAEPNNVYDIGFYDTGGDKAENKLFTDGTVTVLEERYGFKKVKVENATFVINSSFEQGELAHADVICHNVDPSNLDFLIFDVRDFGRGIYDSYESSPEKPYVYTKKMN